jgi:type I restriction enzyme, S subunit
MVSRSINLSQHSGHWEWIPLSEVGTFVGGATPKNSSVEAWGGTLPWVSPKDMKSIEIKDTQDHLSQSLLDPRIKIIPRGAVLIVTHSNILAHTLPVAVAMRDLTINQDLKALIPKERFDPLFVTYAIKANSSSILSRCIKRGLTVASLDFKQLRAERIPIPSPDDPNLSLEIQKRIVRHLDGLLVELKNAREIVDRMRLDTGRVVSTALEETINNLDDEFPVATTVGELCSSRKLELIGGKTPNKSNESYWTGSVPWVSPKDMKHWRIGDSQDHVSQAAIEEEKLKVLPPGAILLVVRGMILSKNLPVAITNNQVTINQDIKAFVPREGLLPDYLGFMFRARKPIILQGVGVAGHGTRRLSSETLSRVAVPMPTLTRQRRVAEYLNSIQRETEEMQKLLEKNRTVLDQAEESILKSTFRSR